MSHKPDENPSPEPISIVNKSINKRNDKGLKGYFFEFILVFLAVVLGFLADNFRETLSNRAQAHNYVSSLVNDLSHDVDQLSGLIERNSWKQVHLDSVDLMRTRFLADPEVIKKLGVHIVYGYCCSFIFKSNDATILQLKNGGGFALLPKNVVDSISTYDISFYRIHEEEANYLRNQNNAIEFLHTLGDFTSIKDGKDYTRITMTSDKERLQEFFNRTLFIYYSVTEYNKLLTQQRTKAINLITFLRGEYGMENFNNGNPASDEKMDLNTTDSLMNSRGLKQ